MRKIFLKKGRDFSVIQGHPWIFSGAIEMVEEGSDGDLGELFSADKKRIGLVYYNSRASIAARLLTKEEISIEKYITCRIATSLQDRKRWFSDITNAYRVINSEGDGLPGLIIDYYNGIFVLQISTLGMEKLKQLVLKALPGPVFEKSKSASRKLESLQPVQGWIQGEGPEEIEIFEGDFRFIVPIVHGQKTGFFLDQRDNRVRSKAFSRDQKILNTFCYTGGFTVAALKGGAKEVVSVDASDDALSYLDRNLALNNLTPQQKVKADVFSFFDNHPFTSEEERFDGIILDPPAFIKKKSDLQRGSGAYRELHLKAFSALRKGGWLLTCSCSHFMEEALFKKVIFGAAKEAGKSVRILSNHPMAIDHPVLLAHPEGAYITSLLLKD